MTVHPRHLLLLGLLLLAAPRPALAALDTARYCSVVTQCLGTFPTVCTPEASKPNEEIEYTAEFCQPLRDFLRRGLKLESVDGYHVMALMGRQYRTSYTIEGDLPINMPMLHYVIDNLPFAAMLINAYRAEQYQARYLRRDKRTFEGSNGRSLRGTFNRPLLSVRPEQIQSFYWGYGYAKVLAWSLKGDGVLEMDFRPVGPRKVHYKVRAYAFPGNSFINGIMHLDIFDDMVHEKIKKIIDDVEGSARKFADGDLGPIRKSKELQTLAGQAYLKEFQGIIEKSSYLDTLAQLLEGAPMPASGKGKGKEAPMLAPSLGPLSPAPGSGTNPEEPMVVPEPLAPAGSSLTPTLSPAPASLAPTFPAKP